MEKWKLNHVKICEKCMDYRVPNSSYPDVGDICKFCGSILNDTGMTYAEYESQSTTLYNQMSEKRKNIHFVEAMRKLKETDPVKYEIAMQRHMAKLNEDKQTQAIDCSAGQPKCPTCGSTNINKISSGKKAIGFLTVGVFSSNFGKTMECKNCGYKW